MKIAPFRIEQYYGLYEFTTRYMLSSSDCESHTVGELLDLEPDAESRLRSLWCGYTESTGLPELRAAIAAIYERTDKDEVLVTSCAEEAIFLLYHAVLGPGDHAVVEAPCYESALQVARSTGADVTVWQRRYGDGWAHDIEELERLLRPNTRMLYINQPHNPTGTLMSAATYDEIVDIASERDIILFSDEVYRELEHDRASRLPAACDIYERAVSLGSISKSYGLAGLRIGWLATRDPLLLEAVLGLKNYTTICSSAPSEFLTALALRHRDVLLDRNLAIVHRNLPLVEDVVGRYPETLDWVRPNASPIGFPRVKGLGDLDVLCRKLAGTGVLLLPGSVYDEPGHVRVGYGRANLPEALPMLEEYLAAHAGARR
jgi:aspartate/methionine/tyrosine aminotransferase